MSSGSDRLWVVTGGPGSGKTSLIDALAREGLTTRPEAGRAVIRSEVACGGNALPWDDRNAFAKAMLAIDIDSYREARATGGPVVFDRGLPDLLGYRKLAGLPPCRPTEAAVRAWRYAPTVFIAPPWPAIYVSDAERRQSWQEAEATWAVMAAVYPACGYRLLELPRLPVAERVHFVRTAVGA